MLYFLLCITSSFHYLTLWLTMLDGVGGILEVFPTPKILNNAIKIPVPTSRNIIDVSDLALDRESPRIWSLRFWASGFRSSRMFLAGMYRPISRLILQFLQRAAEVKVRQKFYWLILEFRSTDYRN